MAIGTCGRCYDKDVQVFLPKCKEKPEKLKGMPIGQYHCPDCGAMLIAGLPHFKLCKQCRDLEHPAYDRG